MLDSTNHTFHIPVMGLSFTVDTPIKIARFGITSAVSIIQDHLLEQMREYHSDKEGLDFVPIKIDDEDYRAKRITKYLNLMDDVVSGQIKKMKKEPFENGNDIVRYFDLLPEDSELKALFKEMKNLKGHEKLRVQNHLKQRITAGKIDVNIMTKLDKQNLNVKGDLPKVEYADAMSALRGFANSQLHSSIIFSAGLNPRLYSYIENFMDFFPDDTGYIKKKVILKVSDYRSALIQGKFLAKKGIWVSEFRIESGLNCGGHAFPGEGKLIGPILEEFKQNRDDLIDELYELCNSSLQLKDRFVFKEQPEIRFTMQGGIGTSEEDKFLREFYRLDGTGWGSPFLMVPEVTNVDDLTLKDLANSKKDDFYLSRSSPLGIPFNNYRNSSSEKQRLKRIQKGRPGSPCYLKFLAFNTEFNAQKPICTASREYQNLKLNELAELGCDNEIKELEKQKILEKDCLCEGLSSTVLLKNGLPLSHNLEAVTICPGPNLAHFTNVLSLEQLVDHIYGRQNVLKDKNRPHIFINELNIYFDFLKEEIGRNTHVLTDKKGKYFNILKKNLIEGLNYYHHIFSSIYTSSFKISWLKEINMIREEINGYCDSSNLQLVFR